MFDKNLTVFAVRNGHHIGNHRNRHSCKGRVAVAPVFIAFWFALAAPVTYFACLWDCGQISIGSAEIHSHEDAHGSHDHGHSKSGDESKTANNSPPSDDCQDLVITDSTVPVAKLGTKVTHPPTIVVIQFGLVSPLEPVFHSYSSHQRQFWRFSSPLPEQIERVLQI